MRHGRLEAAPEASAGELNATFFLFTEENRSIALKADFADDQLDGLSLDGRQLVFISHGYMDRYPKINWPNVGVAGLPDCWHRPTLVSAAQAMKEADD